jgi:PTS system fructose-specific IIC component
VRLATILDPACVVLDVGAGTKSEILARLAAPLVRAHPGLDSRAVLTELERRESECSTAIADGIAIPHARTTSSHVAAVLGRAPAGIDFASLDGKPTTLIVVLVTPVSDPDLHSAWLAHIARVLSDGATRRALLDASSIEGIFDTIGRREVSFEEARRASSAR